MEKILDHYNSVQPIVHEDIEIDIDMDDEVERLIFSGGMGIITNSKTGIVKRFK